MANPKHIALLKKGVKTWNEWRADNPELQVDLSREVLGPLTLKEANLADANLEGISAFQADWTGADLSNAFLRDAYFFNVNLAGAILKSTALWSTDLIDVNLNRAMLIETDFAGASLCRVDMSYAILRGCQVYGISVWDVDLTGAEQSSLVIRNINGLQLTLDSLEMAQFIYLLLNSKNIRHVIDTITSKVVLILGRFTQERKMVLDALREELRKRDYLPIVFDFDKPSSRDLTETISTLAHMARFVVADITDAKSVPQELMRIVPSLPSVPIQPLLLASEDEYGMFEHFKRFPWVLKIFRYKNAQDAVQHVSKRVIGPAEAKAQQMAMGNPPPGRRRPN